MTCEFPGCAAEVVVGMFVQRGGLESRGRWRPDTPESDPDVSCGVTDSLVSIKVLCTLMFTTSFQAILQSQLTLFEIWMMLFLSLVSYGLLCPGHVLLLPEIFNFPITGSRSFALTRRCGQHVDP